MTARRILIGLLSSTALTAAGAVATNANAASCAGSPYVVGDVFASVASGNVNVYTPTGTLVCTLSDGTFGFTTGSAFDTSGNFYVTNFGTTTSKFDNMGNLVNASFFTDASQTMESVLPVASGPFAGNTYIGGPSRATITQFVTATGGPPTTTLTVAAGNGTSGTDWTDLSLDGHTLLYDGEGTHILTWDLATNTQGADFTSAATEAALTHIFEFRVIPTGAFAGDVLVANSSDAVLLDSSGNIIKTYTLPGDTGLDFALNLDPNGTDFWTGDAHSQNVWEVNIATGAIDNQWVTGTGASTLYGLSVFGELVSSQPPPMQGVPEPGTLALLGGSLLGLGAIRRRRKAS